MTTLSGISMLRQVIQKQRPLNWLRLNRLHLTAAFSRKFEKSMSFGKYMYKSKKESLSSLFFFYFKSLRKSELKMPNPNASSKVVNKCFYCGYSRGVRWGISRIKILINVFRGNLNMVGQARW